MRAKPMAGKAGQVMLGTRRSDDRVGIPQHDEIAFPIKRELEALRCRWAIEHLGHAGQRRAGVHQTCKLDLVPPVDANEGAKGAVVAHKRIGDWADHANRSGAEAAIELVLEKDDVRLTVGDYSVEANLAKVISVR